MLGLMAHRGAFPKAAGPRAGYEVGGFKGSGHRDHTKTMRERLADKRADRHTDRPSARC
jgi:hypothetical protein